MSVAAYAIRFPVPWALALALCACGGGNSPDASPADAFVPGDNIDAPESDGPPPPPGTNCAFPLEVEPDGVYEGDTSQFPGNRTASCSGGTTDAPDVFYRMDMGEQPRDLILDGVVDESADPPFDLVLSARAVCSEFDTEIDCIDRGFSEHLELLALTGLVTVIVDGTNYYGGRAGGPYTLTARTRQIVPVGEACDPAGLSVRCAAGARCVGATSTCVEDSPELLCSLATDITSELETGPFEITTTTHAFTSDFHQAGCGADSTVGTGEDVYRIELSQPAGLTATTEFDETAFDTVLYLTSGDCDGDQIACHDDIDLDATNLASRLEVADLPAGVYYLFVDGSSEPGFGAYRLRVELD